MDVAVQPGMIHEDLQAAADEQDQEQEVDVVGDAKPCREADRTGGPLDDRRARAHMRGSPATPHWM